MEVVLDNNSAFYIDENFQGLFPEAQFMRSGRLVAWVFGAKWKGNIHSFTELQIWRPVSEDGVYTKVGSTRIVTSENQTQLYHYPLFPPLHFQAGDVLGYYQPPSESSLLSLYYENDVQLGYCYNNTPGSPTFVRQSSIYCNYQIFRNVVTGENFVH